MCTCGSWGGIGKWAWIKCCVETYTNNKLEKKGLCHLWDCKEKRGRTSSCLVSFGTDCIRGEEWLSATIIAIGVKSLELSRNLNLELSSEIQCSNYVHRWVASQPTMTKFLLDLLGDPESKMAKLFSSRNNCSCLKDAYKVLKTESKKGLCSGCHEMKDRRELMLCQGCKAMNYCSKSCQRANWLEVRNTLMYC